jgi:hypothetical protein
MASLRDHSQEAKRALLRHTIVGALLWVLIGALLPSTLEAREPSPGHDRGMSTAQRVFEAAGDKVVVIRGDGPHGERQGSGVVIHSAASVAQVVTAWHVVRDSKSVNVIHQGNRMVGHIAYADESLDLAIILVNGKDLSAVPVAVGTDDMPVGYELFAIGSPLGLENTITQGLFSGHRYIGGVRMLQTDATVAPGSSGGGLFDEGGTLVGVVVSRPSEGEGFAFAIDASVLNSIQRGVTVFSVLVGVLRSTENRDDLAFLVQNTPSFVHWLMTADTGSGVPLVDSFGDIVVDSITQYGGNFVTGLSESPEFLALVDGTVDRFKREVHRHEQAPPREPSASPGPRSGGTVTLVCSFYEIMGEQHELKVEIDFDQNTINGHPLVATEGRIFYPTGNEDFVMYLDRFSGTLIGVFESGSMEVGECKPIDSRRF